MNVGLTSRHQRSQVARIGRKYDSEVPATGRDNLFFLKVFFLQKAAAEEERRREEAKYIFFLALKFLRHFFVVRENSGVHSPDVWMIRVSHRLRVSVRRATARLASPHLLSFLLLSFTPKNGVEKYIFCVLVPIFSPTMSVVVLHPLECSY